MTILDIIDTFTFYGLDTILLASLTALTVQILKATVLKRVQKKILTFLPFFIGTLFFIAYKSAVNLDIAYVLHNYTDALEHGLSVGAAATLLYVLYEQFVRTDDTASVAEGVILSLIDGYVKPEGAKNVAGLIAKALSSDVTGGGAERIAQIIAEHALEGVTENDGKMLASLIIETMARTNL